MGNPSGPRLSSQWASDAKARATGPFLLARGPAGAGGTIRVPGMAGEWRSRMRVVAGLIFLLAAGGAAGQDRWQYVGDGTEDGFSAYMDTATLSRTGDYANAWFEYRYAKNRRLSRTSNLAQINCVKRTLSLQSSTEYGLDGRVVGGRQASSEQAHIIPQSVGELLWGAACRSEAEPQGIREIGALAERLRAQDPDYDRKIAELGATMRAIEALFPPTLWADVMELEYKKLR